MPTPRRTSRSTATTSGPRSRASWTRWRMLPPRPSSRSTPACWGPWMCSPSPPPFRSWSRSASTSATAWTSTREHAMTTAQDSARGRIAVVTGGAGAIGTAITRALHGTGHRAVVLDRDGRCDVFVHCAAAFDQVTLADADAATWRHVQAVNVESALWLAQAFTPGMAERRFGRIVFITSDTFWAPPTSALLAYVASKGALLGVMRTLAVTLGADGIAVSAVAPGLTDTPASR